MGGGGIFGKIKNITYVLTSILNMHLWALALNVFINYLHILLLRLSFQLPPEQLWGPELMMREFQGTRVIYYIIKRKDVMHILQITGMLNKK